jgi:hypothetical protein
VRRSLIVKGNKRVAFDAAWKHGFVNTYLIHCFETDTRIDVDEEPDTLERLQEWFGEDLQAPFPPGALLHFSSPFERVG